ncbi:class I SAM-dependent methyltransferase [Desulfosoma caldarium]|uniref:Putative methyltransferase family protein n=1 Tax=Desulfosoma caldarium TaxID=610254 RepID=A0A3N1VMH6_9BACT|nr:class I SAM-dependent methyltransferase [Desulfosoma caldarium]ROR03160.1 putative methyltransferase family protein [Desulfosoma caldarium]
MDEAGAWLDRGASEYVQDVEFPSGFVADLTPAILSVVAAFEGYQPPDPAGPFRYAELGCGDGTTLLALAAVNPQATFVGVDFNAAHIAEAERVRARLGLDNVRFVQGSFAELAAASGQPLGDDPFDYMVSNGCYGWLDRKQRLAVEELVKDRLRPGGLLFVEYLAQPGKAAIAAMWKLAQALAPPTAFDTSRRRAEHALKELEKLAKRGMGFFAAYPGAAATLRRYLTGGALQGDTDRLNHFAHNSLAAGFEPRYFHEMYDRMEEIGLSYAGSTMLHLNDPELAVPPAQVPTLREQTGHRLRELIKDFIRNTHTRRDVWVMRAEADRDGADAWLAGLRLFSRMPADAMPRSLAVNKQHQVPLVGPLYEQLIAASDTHAGASLKNLGLSPAQAAVGRKMLLRLLASGGYLLGIRPASEIGHRGRLQPVNRWLLERALERGGGGHLVSPVTGGAAISCHVVETALLLSLNDAEDWNAPDRVLQRARALLDQTQSQRKNQPEVKEDDLRSAFELLAGRKRLNMQRTAII